MSYPVILYRSLFNTNEDKYEFECCSRYFDTYSCRNSIPGFNNVIGRYSVLPYYKEICDDLNFKDSYLINTYREHSWIASFEWYEYLKDYTPCTWQEHDIYKLTDADGPFIAKGKTNSKKFKWDTHMFARNKSDLVSVINNVYNDDLISSQGIVVRKYVPLKLFEVGINGLPFTNEWRFFCYKDTIVSYGYYWTTLNDMSLPYINDDGINLVQEVMNIASRYTTFYVLDVAETMSNEWILIEVNDGQMSGLSMNNPDMLYKNLSNCFN